MRYLSADLEMLLGNFEADFASDGKFATGELLPQTSANIGPINSPPSPTLAGGTALQVVPVGPDGPPGIPDNFARNDTRARASPGGVVIRRYPKQVLHAKLFLANLKVVYAGSANFDEGPLADGWSRHPLGVFACILADEL